MNIALSLLACSRSRTPLGALVPVINASSFAKLVTHYLDASDSRILDWVSPTGRLELFGKKDSNGVPIAIESAKIRVGSGEQVILTFDSSSRLTTLKTANVIEQIDWYSSTHIGITMTTLDGQYRVS